MKKLLIVGIFLFLSTLGFAQTTGTVQLGKASYYTRSEHKITANGESFKDNTYTAAHRTLPFNSIVRVTNVRNNQSVDVRINNRGPYKKGRIVDLSKIAFTEIAPMKQGVASVKLTVLSRGNKKAR
jgi:rare lipoprotein A